MFDSISKNIQNLLLKISLSPSHYFFHLFFFSICLFTICIFEVLRMIAFVDINYLGIL